MLMTSIEVKLPVGAKQYVMDDKSYIDKGEMRE